MRKLEKIKRFEEAFERGRKGKVKSFELWLKEVGLDPEKFSYSSISEYFFNHPEITSNREEELTEIAEFIGYFTRERSGLYHLPVIGVSGSGKTQFLVTVTYFLEQIGSELKAKIYNAAEFGDVFEDTEEPHLFYILDELDKEAPDIILIDSCEKDRDIVESISRISRKLKGGVIITAWTPEFWFYRRDAVDEVLPITKEILLAPLSQGSTTELVNIIMEYVGGEKLSKEALATLYQYSRGIPRVVITLLIAAFREAFLKQKDNLDEESLHSAAKVLGLGIDEKLKELSEQRLTILKHILLTEDKRGKRPTELVEILNLNKATVSYHLQSLMSESLLKSERFGRSIFYKIRDEIKPFVQLRVAQEGEYYE
jgi:DNA-binding transcriptional ArsR family regulator